MKILGFLLFAMLSLNSCKSQQRETFIELAPGVNYTYSGGDYGSVTTIPPLTIDSAFRKERADLCVELKIVSKNMAKVERLDAESINCLKRSLK